MRGDAVSGASRVSPSTRPRIVAQSSPSTVSPQTLSRPTSHTSEDTVMLTSTEVSRNGVAQRIAPPLCMAQMALDARMLRAGARELTAELSHQVSTVPVGVDPRMPQHNGVPSSPSTHVERVPVAMARTLPNGWPGTTGVGSAMLYGHAAPNAPNSFDPQHLTAPSIETVHVWSLPAAKPRIGSST